MNKFIPLPICLAVILGFVATTSGFKCYECDYVQDGSGNTTGDPDCENNAEQLKFEVTCPEFPTFGSQTTFKNTGQQKIADYVMSLLPSRNDKPLTQAILPTAVYHHCMKGVATGEGTTLVFRSCYPSAEPLENECKTEESGGIKAEVCVCDTELCNGNSLGGIGTICKLDKECPPGMYCIEERCNCRDPFINKYDMDDMVCITSAGGKCFLNETESKCTENSKCVDDLCQCDEDFLMTEKGECLKPSLGLGESCTLGRCDFSQGLACISGTCTCVWDSLTFVPGEGCLAPLNGRCGYVPTNPQKCLTIESEKCEFYSIKCGNSTNCKEISPGLSKCIDVHMG
jgi:hypothetical protein